MKHKIKIFLYVATGLFLVISGFSEWASIGFLWGDGYTVDGEAGGMNLTIIIIGLVFIVGGYIEYDLNKPIRSNDNQSETNNNDYNK